MSRAFLGLPPPPQPRPSSKNRRVRIGAIKAKNPTLFSTFTLPCAPSSAPPTHPIALCSSFELTSSSSSSTVPSADPAPIPAPKTPKPKRVRVRSKKPFIGPLTLTDTVSPLRLKAPKRASKKKQPVLPPSPPLSPAPTDLSALDILAIATASVEDYLAALSAADRDVVIGVNEAFMIETGCLTPPPPPLSPLSPSPPTPNLLIDLTSSPVCVPQIMVEAEKEGEEEEEDWIDVEQEEGDDFPEQDDPPTTLFDWVEPSTSLFGDDMMEMDAPAPVLEDPMSPPYTFFAGFESAPPSPIVLTFWEDTAIFS